ncbi:MAG: hypothetical protein ACR2JB_09590 [Bryobacteraceae bacterium]
MRILAFALLAACTVVAADVIDAFGYHWTVPTASDWKIEKQGGVPVLRLVTLKGPLPGPRRPIQFALAETPEFRSVTVDLDARPLGRSLIVVFAYRDSAHFDYAHLSTDPASKEHVHNGVFHVYGGARVRISAEAGPAAFRATNRWYHVRLTYDGGSGAVEITVNGRSIPALHAIDLSLRSGKVGIGSFDETGDFKNVKIQGIAVSAKASE